MTNESMKQVLEALLVFFFLVSARRAAARRASRRDSFCVVPYGAQFQTAALSGRLAQELRGVSWLLGRRPAPEPVMIPVTGRWDPPEHPKPAGGD